MLEHICLIMQLLLIIGMGGLIGYIAGYFSARKMNKKDFEKILDDIKKGHDEV